MASIRLPDGLLNSAGNPVHLIGLSWAGGMGTPETRTAPYDVTGASGACLLLATTVWKQLGGFDEEYFAYLEDSELSLRAWRLGLAARCVPTAVARHHYEFSRNAHKMHLLERNRLMLLATVWPRRALILLAPVLAACELGLLALGTVQRLAQGRWLRLAVAPPRAPARTPSPDPGGIRRPHVDGAPVAHAGPHRLRPGHAVRERRVPGVLVSRPAASLARRRAS